MFGLLHQGTDGGYDGIEHRFVAHCCFGLLLQIIQTAPGETEEGSGVQDLSIRAGFRALEEHPKENARSTPHALHHRAPGQNKDFVSGHRVGISKHVNRRFRTTRDGSAMISIAKGTIQFIQALTVLDDVLEGA